MEDWNPNDPRDYIDMYLAEMQKVRWRRTLNLWDPH